MKSQPRPDLKTALTEGNKGNEERGVSGGRMLAYRASRSGLPRNFLSCLRSLLFNSLVAAAALLPAHAGGQAIEVWVQRYNGPGNLSDYPTAMALDASSDVYVTGTSGSSAGPDWATIKYSSAGVPLWTNRYNGPGDAMDLAAAMALDLSDNVIVTGWSAGYGSATIKYSSDGVPLWTNRYDGARDYIEHAMAAAVD